MMFNANENCYYLRLDYNSLKLAGLFVGLNHIMQDKFSAEVSSQTSLFSLPGKVG